MYDVSCSVDDTSVKTNVDDVDAPDDDMSELLDSAFDNFIKTEPQSNSAPKDKPSGEDDDDILKNFEHELNKCLKNMSDSLTSLNDPKLYGDESEGAEDLHSGMDSFFEGLLHQFLSKDLVYPPLKMVSNKYPQWLKDNKTKLSNELFEQRQKQHEKIEEVCIIYESYTSDGNLSADHLQQIMSLIEEAMSNGAPPSELVEEGDGGDSLNDMLKNFEALENKLDPENCAMM